MWSDPLRKFTAVGIVLFFIFSSIPIAKCTATENESKSEFPSTGFFYVAEKNGVWWFVTPEGEKFYSIGAGSVQPGMPYYGNYSDWVKIVDGNLKNWGFNTIMWSQYPKLFLNMSYIHIFSFKSIAGDNGWACRRFPDVFDPEWREAVRKQINDTVKDLRDDPNLIGYQTDNEMKWGPDIGDYDHGNDTLMELFMDAKTTTPGKQRLISFLSERYDNNTELFNRVWNMNVSSFKELENYKKFGFEGWRVQSGLKSAKIKLFKDYPNLSKEPQLLKQAEKDITDFSRLAAETYFNVTSTALKSADPNHLNLGVRFHLFGVPMEVLEECGKYCDVISFNYYRSNIFVCDPSVCLTSIKYDCVTRDQWMRKYYDITGKPLIVSECGFDSTYGIDYLRSIFSGSPLQKARTQQGLVARDRWYMENCFKSPYVIGTFCWYSHLVDIWDQPHPVLVNNTAKINKKAIELHEKASIKEIDNNDKEPKLIDFFNKKTLFFTLLYDGENYRDYLIKFLNFEIEPADYSLTANEVDGIKNIEVAYNYDAVFYHEPDIYVDNDSECPGAGTKEHPYCKIQYALDNASDGETIFVYNGIYDEKIIINKSINLMGENRENTVIRGTYEEPDSDLSGNNIVITIKANHVNITGFNITSIGGYLHNLKFTRECCGVYLNNYSDCNISGNNFYNLGHFGIKVLRGENTIIKNNILYKALDKEGCNIFLDSSNHSLVKNNYLFKSTICCLWISRCTDCGIQDNIMLGSPSEIVLQKDDNNIVSGNIIDNNAKNSDASGIFLVESDRNTIKNNNFISAFISVKSIDFFDSYGNIWDGNYWGRPMILPKLIFGRAGAEFFIPLVNIDHHPLKEPYKP